MHGKILNQFSIWSHCLNAVLIENGEQNNNDVVLPFTNLTNIMHSGNKLLYMFKFCPLRRVDLTLLLEYAYKQ